MLSLLFWWQGVRFWIRGKEYRFPTLELFSLKMEIKFELKDFDVVELHNDSFLLKWWTILPVASTELFFCDCERQL